MTDTIKMKEHPINIKLIMLITLSLRKGSPHVQYIDELLQRNLIENQKTLLSTYC